MVKFTVVIDESGEAGITKVRTAGARGASPYLTLGACIYHTSHEDILNQELERISGLFGKPDLHCSSLSHFQKVRYAREIRNSKFLAFGTISKKSTLGSYKNKIEEDSKRYYNKCAQYLLEQIGRFIERHKIIADDVDLIFEEGNFDYASLRNLVRKCQSNPIHENSKFLAHISANKIRSLRKKDLPTLSLADLIAHALYKCVDKPDKDCNIPEPRYLQELSRKFFAEKTSKSVLDYGIKCIHDIGELDLDIDIAAIIKNLKSE